MKAFSSLRHAFIACAAVLAFYSGACSAQSSSSKKVLLALSKTEHTLAIVDPASLKVITKIPVGEDPHEVIASPDGKTAYVANYGGGTFHELNVADLVNNKALPHIDITPLMGAHDLTFNNGKVWFTAEGSKSIGRYDPATGKLDWSMGTGQDRTHMIIVSPDGKRIYTTNISSGTVSILTDSVFQPGTNAPSNARPRNQWVHTIIQTHGGVEGFDVSPDGTKLWAAASQDGGIYVINLISKKLEQTIDAKAFGANRLKITPDGKLAFVSSLSTGDIFIYDTQSRQLVKKLKVGNGASGMLMDPDGNRAFIACSPDNNIAVVDLKTLQIMTRIDVGKVPDGMAWANRP